MTTADTETAADARLPSRWVHALAGACCLFTGWAFWYLDRSYGDFGPAGTLWFVATVLGFATGALNLHRGGPAGRIVCALLGALLALIAIYPGYVLYSLLRWLALCLMFATVARAALMRTRRDLYFALLACFVCSSVAAIHHRADWTLWVYLGPAWLCAGLALTVEYVASHAVGAWTKTGASLAFVGATAALAAALFLFLPRPATLGFGFLPPGADVPALTQSRGGGSAGEGRRGGIGSSGDAAAAAPDGLASSSWQRMIDAMRQSLADPHMPRWQRALLQRGLDGAAAVAGLAEGVGIAVRYIRIELPRIPPWVWAVSLLACLALHAAWQRRHLLALQALGLPAWLLQRLHPAWSMRLSAWMLGHALTQAGAGPCRQRTLRERLQHTHGVPPLGRRWCDEALDLYYAMRFGRAVASPARAGAMRSAVLDAVDLLAAARRDAPRPPHR
jgi:hypothetical protein